jgi:hypothetical protein
MEGETLTGQGELRRLTSEISEELFEGLEVLRLATNRDLNDIVSGALRTYLADQRQRDVVDAFFIQAQTRYPRPYLVTATVTLDRKAQVDSDIRERVETTLGLIRRYVVPEITWTNEFTFVIRMGASGHDSNDANRTVDKMIRNRIVEELGLSLADNAGVTIVGSDLLPDE